MTSTNKAVILIAAATVVMGAVPTLRAETLVVGDQVMVRQSDILRPARGLTMTAVEAKFGSPRERHPTVGQPPITRWDYEHFAVFFEKDRVVDTVVTPGADSTPVSEPASVTQPAEPSQPPAAAAVPAPLA